MTDRVWDNHDYGEFYSDGKPVITFYADKPMLLIEWPSGVVYSTQAGGIMCNHPAAEGVLMEFPFGVDTNAMAEAVDEIGCCSSVSESEADTVDKALAESRLQWFRDNRLPLSVDRTLLESSTEAWVYLNIAPDADGCFKPFRGRRAILTWENCD